MKKNHLKDILRHHQILFMSKRKLFLEEENLLL